MNTNKQDSDYHYEIFLAQLNALTDPYADRLLIRVAHRFYKGFSQKSLKQKVYFLIDCLFIPWRWVNRTLINRRLQQLVFTPYTGPSPKPFSIAVSCAGALGDLMHQAPALEAFYLQFGPMNVDFFASPEKFDGRAQLFARGLPFIRNIYDSRALRSTKIDAYYDLHIEIRHIVKYHVLSPDRLKTLKPALANVIRIAGARYEPYDFIFKSHPYLDGLFGRLMAMRNMNAIEASAFFGGISGVDRTWIPAFCPSPAALQTAARFDLFGKPYITIHDGFEIEKIGQNTASGSRRITRSWPPDYWTEFIRLLKIDHPHILIVQIGISKTSERIKGVDVDLLDKTTMDESCWIIKNARLHMDTESGIMRVAWATNTPAISLQGPTGTPFFQIGSVKSIISAFCNYCHWVKPDFNLHCLRGFERPECMYAITPDAVAKTAIDMLRSRQNYVAKPRAIMDIEALVEKTDTKIVIIGIQGCPDNILEHLRKAERNITIIIPNISDASSRIEQEKNILIRFGNPLNLPIATKSADILISRIYSDAHVESEYLRILKCGGKCIVFGVDDHIVSVMVQESLPSRV